MNKNPPIGLGRLFLLGLLSLLCHAKVQAQVNFVQLTDPHLFDDNWPVESRLDDHAALASCISEINQRHNTGGKYLFVVVTGDLGIENLVERAQEKKSGPPDEDAIQRSLERGALELAPLLNLSAVKRWLFVPGNNDVLEEVPKNVRFYHDFMRYLDGFLKNSGTIKIFDLCPWDGSSNGESYASQSAMYQDAEHPDYAFIGFNDASFKNVQRPTDIDAYAVTEKALEMEEFDRNRSWIQHIDGVCKRFDVPRPPAEADVRDLTVQNQPTPGPSPVARMRDCSCHHKTSSMCWR